MRAQRTKTHLSTGRTLLLQLGLFVGCLMAFPGAAQANDSTARLAIGGLVMTQSNSIEMRSEDLYLASDRIEIRYVFYNRTGQDVTTIVAFPLPDVPAPSDVERVFVPFEDAEANFVGFSTTVDGTDVPVNIEQRALALGIDRSDILRRSNIPLASYRPSTLAALNGLPTEQLEELHSLGLVDFSEYDAGNGMVREVQPLWKTQTTFYWTQTFPARREVVIEHAYTPATGASAQTMVGTDYSEKNYVDSYCMDRSFLRAVKRTVPRNGAAPFMERRLEYILTTAANWAGPIGSFRLVVDKGNVRNLVSFCGDGIRKIGPTQFEMTKNDFWPQRNLEILFLERHQY